MKKYRTLKGLRFARKRVLLRAGFDVPLTPEGAVADDTRIRALLPTMQMILKGKGILVLLAHQGRPKGPRDHSCSQKPLVPVLRKLLKTTVHFSSDCVGPTPERVIAAAKPGEVVLLENLRFHPGEKKNDPAFALALSKLGDIYVNDAFTNCHREHASMVALPKLLPSYMGLSLHTEIMHLQPILKKPRHPLTLIIAGAKMETKVPVIRRFLVSGEHILVGGCIANTFIAARGFDVGSSRYDLSELEMAQEFMLEGEKDIRADIHVPRDVVVASSLSEKAEKLDIPVEDVIGDMSIYDIGKVTIRRYVEIIERSKTIVWNGPVGVYEYNRFSHASKRIAEAIVRATKKGATSIIGGGDTIDFHARYKYSLKPYTFVSMGGGAMLEYIAGKNFASLRALEVRPSRRSAAH